MACLLLVGLGIYQVAFFAFEKTGPPVPSDASPVLGFEAFGDLIFAAFVLGIGLTLTVIFSSIGLLKKERPVFSIVPLVIATPILAYMLLLILSMR